MWAYYCSINKSSQTEMRCSRTGLGFTMSLKMSLMLQTNLSRKERDKSIPQTINSFNNCKFIISILHTQEQSPYSIIINDIKTVYVLKHERLDFNFC